MRICIVAEGCYPYVVGGVSSWIHSLVKSFPNHEFVLLSVVANRKVSGQFKYEIPENLTQIYEVYLDDFDWDKRKKRARNKLLNKKEYIALRNLVLNRNIDWPTIINIFQKKKFSLDDLLMGADFLHIAQECYNLKYPQIVFSDFLWTLRSIYLPLFFVLKSKIPDADLYHCVATGYSGVLGGMAKHLYGCKLLVSEHGIYTREREEELIKAKWVQGLYKDIWIDQFKKMSALAYGSADLVTSLYEHARELQIELGCPEHKTVVTPNGISVERLSDLEGKLPEDNGYINIGAVLRVAPIKDVKTMIQSFHFAKMKIPNLKLWLMGPVDEDKEYAQQCFDMVKSLKVEDVIFTGRIDVKEYLGRMDFTMLTSISEGQPLTILESFAARKPVIATDVGNCRELIYGSSDDEYGTAGILTHIMNIEEITDAIQTMALNEELRTKMGENGFNRVMAKFKIQDMKKQYEKIYREFSDTMLLEWTENKFTV